MVTVRPEKNCMFSFFHQISLNRDYIGSIPYKRKNISYPPFMRFKQYLCNKRIKNITSTINRIK